MNGKLDVPPELAPNYQKMKELLYDVNEIFGMHKNSDSLQTSILIYMNDRVEKAIEAGEWRTVYITPDNRLAHYQQIIIRPTPDDPRRISIVQSWEFEEDQ